MLRIPSILLTLACACTFALAAPGAARAAKTSFPKGCPDFQGTPSGYMIGSSTMGSVMGPMLRGMLKRRWKVQSRQWGKASSGLARPDFHDWPRKARGLMARYKPDFVIVSLGTNDNQALRVGKKWLPPKRREKWEKLYAERVQDMLKALAGPDLARPIVWMGPTAFEGRAARVMGPRINAIMKREVEAFEGNATFIDVYRATRKPNGKMVTDFQAPDRKQPEGLRDDDGIHLTARAVKYLMAEPALAPLEPCFAGHLTRWKEAEKKRAEERRLKAEARRAERERKRAERKAKRIEANQAKLARKRAAKAARLEARRLRLAPKKPTDSAGDSATRKSASKAAVPAPSRGASAPRTDDRTAKVTPEELPKPKDETERAQAKPKGRGESGSTDQAQDTPDPKSTKPDGGPTEQDASTKRDDESKPSQAGVKE